ncbi:DUF3368 domain-containing protein [Limosilactobacillus sp.]|uniref:DUF3368 domain-containing protein n=1 Tax=Limosilactobacillus sp. TaxID=2773925 RepID=UPI0035A154DC
MSEQGVHYTDLDADAKETALKSFISYYINQYQQNNLEILGSKVDNGVMSTINEILNLNKFMGHTELIAESYRLSKPCYEKLLNELTDVLYQEDGEPVSGWEKNWEEQEIKLPNED